MSSELVAKLRATAAGLGSEDPRNYAARGIDVGHCLQAADTIEALLAALQEIVAPIAAMRDRSDSEGLRLDGMMANMLARDPEYLRGIARAAISKATLPTDKGGV